LYQTTKMKNTLIALIAIAFAMSISACKKDNQDDGPKLIFKFKFDSTQVRLNNIGQPATLPAGHAAQSPVFRKMCAHYIELAPTAFTALGSGKVLYRADETTAGGSNAIDFAKAKVVAEGEDFFSIPLSSVTPGTYEWLRISLAYQNYDIKYRQSGYNGTGTVASFLGFNSYIGTYNINTQPITVNANRAQGYWAFETNVFGQYYTASGQAPAGATTVVNPLASSSPIPAGSCVVTGPFGQALTITGNETEDIIITVSLSTNKSFEWTDNGDGVYEPSAGDQVIDMGVRGLIPTVE
jgi:hypothetical protein